MSNLPAVLLDSPTTVEKLRATVYTTADPTAGAVKWQLTAIGSAPSSGAAWKSGAWSGTWDAEASTATAVSPDVVATLGAVAGGRYSVWVQWVVGAETPERLAGELVVRG